MAFTNVWDNTVPSDAELANLYAKNLRDFRTDVQQRMAQMSGPLASAPTFESPAFNGVLYFAVDTGQILQWQGSWVDVSTILGPRSFVNQTPLTATGAQVQQIYSVPIPAALFTPTTRVRISFFFTTAGAGTITTNLLIDATTAPDQNMIVPAITSGGGNSLMALVEGGNYGNLTTQNWLYTELVHGGAGQLTLTTVDTSNFSTFLLVYTGSAPSSSATYYGISVELL